MKVVGKKQCGSILHRIKAYRVHDYVLTAIGNCGALTKFRMVWHRFIILALRA
jgi:hypothetical protein